MKQLTVRGFDPDLVAALQRVARRRDISLNKAALWLLRKGAGLGEPNQGPDVIGDSLDEFVGSWSEGETAEFLENIRCFDEIDDEMWQ